jgi:hypothetical protein
MEIQVTNSFLLDFPIYKNINFQIFPEIFEVPEISTIPVIISSSSSSLIFNKFSSVSLIVSLT